MDAKSTAADAVKTEVLKTPGSLGELLNVLVLHELLNVKDRPQAGPPSDPTHRKDQKNELAVAQFRIYFKDDYPNLSEILDQIFVIMKTSDYRHFSLSVLESISASAYSKDDPTNEDMVGKDKPFFMEKINIVSTGGKGGKGEKAKQTMVVMPNFHYKGNYGHFITLIATIIDNNDRDPKKIIRFLDECGIISQSVVTRLARHFTPDKLEAFHRFVKELLEKLGEQLNPWLDEVLPKTVTLKKEAKTRFESAKASRT